MSNLLKDVLLNTLPVYGLCTDQEVFHGRPYLGGCERCSFYFFKFHRVAFCHQCSSPYPRYYYSNSIYSYDDNITFHFRYPFFKPITASIPKYMTTVRFQCSKDLCTNNGIGDLRRYFGIHS